MRTSAADEVGATPPRFAIPMALLHIAGHLVGALGALLRRDFAFTATGARLMALTSPADHSKATRELGWHPEPTEQAIRRAARFYLERSNA
jgi:nucleoside-diphosphate-sugar epimerase